MLERLDKEAKQKLALAVVVYLILFSVFDSTIMKKIYIQKNLVKNEYMSAESTYELSEVKSASIFKKREELKNEVSILEESKSRFISENDKEAVLNLILSLGKEHGLRIDTIDIAVDENSGAGGYKEYRIFLNAVADYKKITYFIENIEEMETMLTVEDVSLTKQGSELGVRISLKGYII